MWTNDESFPNRETQCIWRVLIEHERTCNTEIWRMAGNTLQIRGLTNNMADDMFRYTSIKLFPEADVAVPKMPL